MAYINTVIQQRPTRVLIDLVALRHNLAAVRRRCGAAAVCALVKADAYGHGAVPVARALVEAGADWLGVALVEEGIELREAGITAPILVVGGALGGADCGAVVANGLTPVISSPEQVDALAAAVGSLRQASASSSRSESPSQVGSASGSSRFGVHLELDTGMSRLGVAEHEIGTIAERLAKHSRCIELRGVMTHLARSDERQDPFTHQQLTAFAGMLATLSSHGLSPALRHVANSGGVVAFSDSYFDMVRPGLMLYGLDPMAEADTTDLEPVLRWTTRIVKVHSLSAGTPVSYGGKWSVPGPQPARVATLPVGYGDGYRRGLSGRAEVLLRGERIPVVGTICMDLCMIDISSLPEDVGVGEEVVLLGRQGTDRISAAEMARWLDTISYEVVCGIAARVPRIYGDSAA